MLLPLTEDRFELDKFYGLNKYPHTTVVYSDNMLIFNYLAKYWIMNGSTLIGNSSTILNEYYETYKDMVVQNGSVVVLEGEIPDGVHVLFLTEDKGRADIVSRMITDSYSEQRLGISGMHTHDIVKGRRRNVFWDDLPKTTWKSEQEEVIHTSGELLSDGRSNLIVGRKAEISRAVEIRTKSFDRELISFGEDVEELESLDDYKRFLTEDNLDNNFHVVIPNLFEVLNKYYRSEVVDNFSEGEYRSMLLKELGKKEEDKRKEFEQELSVIRGERLIADFTDSKQRVLRHWKRQVIKELDRKVSQFMSDKTEEIHEGYPGLKLVGAGEAMRGLLELLDKIYLERGIIVTMSLPIVGIKVTRMMRVFQKEIDGYQGAIDDLVLSLLKQCLFAFHDLGDLIVTDFKRNLSY